MPHLTNCGRLLLAATLFAAFTLAYNVQMTTTADANSTLTAAVQPSDPPNPLLPEWEGPYGGVPPFDRVHVADFKPALEAGMAENLADVDRIAKDPAAPTFENTIVALERSGQTLDRVQTIYGVFGSTMNGPEFQVVQREMAPRLSAFYDQTIGFCRPMLWTLFIDGRSRERAANT